MSELHMLIRRLSRSDASQNARALNVYLYINRKGKYTSEYLARFRKKGEKEERLLASDNFYMPDWASDSNGDYRTFWTMADQHERAGGPKRGATLLYTFEASFHRDLTPEARLEVIRRFCASELMEGHPISWGIHETTASDGKPNPHVHFAASDRKIDSIDRSAELFFKQANKKNPKIGGARKDRRWNSRSFIHEVRKSWTQISNELLLELGSHDRVEHRSFAARGIDRQPGVHDGPHRLAMKARGIKLRPRPSQIGRHDEQRAKAAEQQSLNSEIHKLETIRSYITMPIRKPAEPEHQATGITIFGGSQKRRDPRDFKQYMAGLAEAFSFTLIWTPSAVTDSGQDLMLPAWRAVHKDDSTREIWFDGQATFRASHEDEASLTLVIESLKAAGFKSATLHGSDYAVARMTELCKLHGIRVEKQLPGAEGFGAPPVPPPQPPTVATKPKKSPKEIDRIRLSIAREIWPDFRVPDLKSRPGRFERALPGREPHDQARSAEGLNHVYWELKATQDLIASRLIDAGIARGSYHLLLEQGFSLDRIHCGALHSEDRKEGGPPKLDPRLCKALRKSAELTGIPLPPELDAAVSRAEAEHAEAKARQDQEQQKTHGQEQAQNKQDKRHEETKEVKIELEPEPE